MISGIAAIRPELEPRVAAREVTSTALLHLSLAVGADPLLVAEHVFFERAWVLQDLARARAAPEACACRARARSGVAPLRVIWDLQLVRGIGEPPG
jgi:hypothetical protein